ncbi:MAG: DUF1569 domain-containing protein [Bacteroidetes bacterium]|nr:DUF1569 domain-containing protein [Bacteroidota bacterium]
MTLDIHNREDIYNRLKNLEQNAKPVFGSMSPQHIVEHLAFMLQVSTGKNPQRFYSTDDVATTLKQQLIYSDAALPHNIKSPVLGDLPPPLIFKDLQTAIENLKNEMNDFDGYYKANPDAKNMQPRMGLLSFQEWTTLHNKHFTHHFSQFNLV